MKDSTMNNNISALGFNGEYLDDTLNNYHLGNGYRAYNPTTMQFTAPDDMSPFGHGGINPYVYCSGDPINNSDPTGHFSPLGLALTIENTLGLTPPREITTPDVIQILLDLGDAAEVLGDAATGGGLTPAIPALNVAESAIVSTLDSATVRETEHIATQQVAPSIEHLASEAGPSRVVERAPEEQILHHAPVQHDAPGAIKSKNEEDFTHLITHKPGGGTSEPALLRIRHGAQKVAEKGRMYIEGDTRCFAFTLGDFEGAYPSLKRAGNDLSSYTNLQPYNPNKDMLDSFQASTNDSIFNNRQALSSGRSLKPREKYKGYLFYKLGD